MKNVLKPVLIIVLLSITFLFAGMQMSELLFVAWGESENELSHKSYPGLHTGPLSFQIEKDGITIFDTENKELKTFYNNGNMSTEKLVDTHVIDFYKNNNVLYLLKPQTIYLRENGETKLIDKLDDPKNMYAGLKLQNGGIQAPHRNGHVECTPPVLNKGQGSEINVTRTLPSSVNIEIGSSTYVINVPEVGSVDYIGSTPDNTHYIYAESITSHVPIAVQRNIYLIDNEGEVLNILHLPQQKFTYIFKEFIVGEDGELYHMQSSKDGIHILKWELVNDNSFETNYPVTYSEKYHFNQFTEAEPEQEIFILAKAADASVTRSEALAIGDEYVSHTWTATSANIGTTATVTTPSWVVVGQNQRVPYKWGGWSTVAQFDAGIAGGQYAGDINTSVVDWGHSVGADCSGFVSVCWKASKKYGTSTFSQCSSQLSSPNNLLPADATNKAGSHIRMVVEWTNDGKLVQIEETASGTPGWAARYYTWTLSQITDYVPIRYDNIINLSAPRPTLLSVTSKPDSISLKWTTDESGVFTGYRVYRKTLLQDNYSVIAQVAKGTLMATVPQANDVHYDYFVAAYNASDSANYNASDIYAAKATDSGKEILIVDGFDRYSGSYGLSVHHFVSSTAKALDKWDIAYGSCANEAVISGDIDLSDYEMVWWICGDESTDDETFNSVEQDIVESYLKQGGKLFVSGSEIAWDLDYSGSTADKAFIHNYLKAAYAGDDAGNYSVSGQTSTVFTSVSLQFSDDGSEADTYAEDYPDYLNTSGGSQIALKYGNNYTAAVSFSGMFSGGTQAGKVITMGFPFETITMDNKREDLAGYILRYMGYTVTVNTETLIPLSCILHQNYPNPFNPLTTIAYSLDKPSFVNIVIYDLQGKLIQNIIQGYRNAGEHEIIFDGTKLPSGVYVYGLELSGILNEIKKMTVLK
ncbi:MAG: T9SS type A sorting domain-containing protein [Candidatus Marinimicrobia bacterium]|nr:T9SS type A sorting domain-containing protein [Candidatus Neomarinimicrobiota bacterium]